MIRLGKFDKQGYKDSFSKGELARELVCMNNDYDKLEKENQKYKEVIDKLNVKLNQYKNDLKAYQEQDTINHRALSIGLIGVKIRVFEDILKEVE